MPALEPTAFYGEVVWLGRVGDRAAALASAPCTHLALGFAGPEGEDHGGLTRPSCSRVSRQYPKGTEIRNTRQVSILSEEELAQIAADMDVAHLDPAWLGATIVLRGLPDLSHLPPSSRLQGQEGGATLVVDMENRPCHLPAPVIDTHLPGKGRGFKLAAKGRRGVTGWVEREGALSVGEQVRLHMPDQPQWAGLLAQ